MMRLAFVSIFLLLAVFSGNCQFFEGKIVYSNTFSSKTKALTDAQLQFVIGSRLDYYIKGCNYKSISNGRSITMQLYTCSINQVYNRTPNSDTLYWFDAAKNSDTLYIYEFKKNADTVLGYICDALVLITKSGTTTLYFNRQFKVNAPAFKNHHYNNWAFFAAQAGSLPLKIIVDSEVFKMESTAIEINQQKIEDSFFLIEDRIPTRKSG